MTEDMNKMTDTTTVDQPPAPNGHGSTNGVANGAVKQDAATHDGAAKDATSSPRKTRAQRRAEKKAAAAAAAAASSDAATAATQETPTLAPAPAPTPAPVATAEPVALPEAVAVPVAMPVSPPVESLRVRMKIWTHPQTARRYLMTSSRWRDLDRSGQPVTDVMLAYAMREDDTMTVSLTATQWNALPFFYMQEDGPAPRTMG